MMLDLQAIFGSGRAPTTAAPVIQSVAAPEPIPRPEAVERPTDHVEAMPFADWVLRPDCHGRMGWEAPGLPESDRWWARFDFDELPVVPRGVSIGELSKPTPMIAPCCVATGSVDTLGLRENRPSQGQPGGFAGA